jgi:hypothetical protein
MFCMLLAAEITQLSTFEVTGPRSAIRIIKRCLQLISAKDCLTLTKLQVLDVPLLKKYLHDVEHAFTNHNNLRMSLSRVTKVARKGVRRAVWYSSGEILVLATEGYQSTMPLIVKYAISSAAYEIRRMTARCFRQAADTLKSGEPLAHTLGRCVILLNE